MMLQSTSESPVDPNNDSVLHTAGPFLLPSRNRLEDSLGHWHDPHTTAWPACSDPLVRRPGHTCDAVGDIADTTKKPTLEHHHCPMMDLGWLAPNWELGYDCSVPLLRTSKGRRN